MPTSPPTESGDRGAGGPCTADDGGGGGHESTPHPAGAGEGPTTHHGQPAPEQLTGTAGQVSDEEIGIMVNISLEFSLTGKDPYQNITETECWDQCPGLKVGVRLDIRYTSDLKPLAFALRCFLLNRLTFQCTRFQTFPKYNFRYTEMI